ncbi:Protein esc2 [Podila epicladia]|nr:Protein esc2 [Podila epicladia]
MADSDEEPVAPKRPQPKPKPRSRMGAKQSTMASPDGTPSSSSTNSSSTLNGSTSPSRHTRIRVIEDDFFSKAKSYRPPKREVSKPEPENILEPLAQEEVLDAVSASKELPIFDFEDEDESRQTSKEKAKADTELKRKRNLSLTPPPEAPVFHYKPAYDAPRSTAPQPSKYDTIDLDDDDDDDVQELDPELASIAQKLSKRVMTRTASDDAMLSPTLQPSGSQSYFSSSSSQPGSRLQSPNSSQDHSGSQETPPMSTTPAIDINIMIRKIRDPRLVVPPEMESVMREIEKPIKFIIKSDQPFRTSMELYCRQKHTQLAEVVFALRGNRLLPSSTPQTVDCPLIAVLDVYEVDAFKYYKEQEKLQDAQRLAQMEMELAQYQQQEEIEKQKEEEEARKKAERDSANGEDEEEEEEDKVEEEEFLFIKLRGLDTQDEKLRVKKSTTIEAVLKHYRRLKKLDPDTPVHLSWDDEDLDPTSTIGDTDVEDDDMLSVRIG